MKINARILALFKIVSARPSEISPKRQSRGLVAAAAAAAATMGDRGGETAKTELRRMYEAGVRGVLPSTIVDESVSVVGKELRVCGKSYDLTSNIYLVGFGKAVMGMAVAMERKLGAHLKGGIVSVPRGSREKFEEGRLVGTLVDYRESSVNNRPDAETLRTSREIVDLASKLGENDTLIVLVSGGGSALLCVPRPGISPDAKVELCAKLQNSGADIREVNVVRRKLSMVKGGGLARMAHPARVITLVLSDIVGDPVDLVASGPTMLLHSENPPGDAISVLRKYRLYDDLEGDTRALVTATDEPVDGSLLDVVDHFVVGNNALAVEAASREALRAGLAPIFLRNDVAGLVEDVSEAYARLASLVCRAWGGGGGGSGGVDGKAFAEAVERDPVLSVTRERADEIFRVLENSPGRGVALIGAGEPTVVVRGSGRGGRNQELALRFSLDWLARVRDDPRLAEFEVTFLSAGTDGQDGPTDATGAFGYAAVGPILRAVLEKLRKLCNDNPSPSERASRLRAMLRQAEKIQPRAALANSDSYNLYSRFRRGQDLLKTGISGTNVMDLHFVLAKKRRCDCRIDFDLAEKRPDILEEHDLRTDFENPSSAPEDRGDEPEPSKLLNLNILDSAMTERCCKKK